MITDKTYTEVKEEMRNIYHGGIFEKHLREYLNEQGYFVSYVEQWNTVERTARPEWPSYPAPLCIACVVANTESDQFHFVVVHNGVVFDPATVSIKNLNEYVRVESVLGIIKPPKQRAKTNARNPIPNTVS